jgi:hypothetical protein
VEGGVNSPAPTRLQKPQIYKRRELTKAVVVEVLSQDNNKVIQRYRFVPPAAGHKQRFTPSGVERVLENFIFSFERDNPNHRYRLVECAGKFRLVWIPEEKPDAQAEEMKAMVEAARQMSPEELRLAVASNSPCAFTMPLPPLDSAS